MFKRKKQHHTSYMLGGAVGGFLMAAGLYALTNKKTTHKKTGADHHDTSNGSQKGRHTLTDAMLESGDEILSGMKDVVEASRAKSSKEEKESKPELAKVIQKTLEHDPF